MGEITLKSVSEQPIKYQWHILRIYTHPHFSYIVNGDKHFGLKLRNKLFGRGFIATSDEKYPLVFNQKSE